MSDTDSATEASLRDWLAVAAAILGAFTAILDIQITNSSLSDIQGALGASSEEGSWISTAYLMAEIIVIPLTGWLGSVFGLRRYLATNTVLFIGFSIACALSTSLTEMILFRAGQGFTGGVLIPTAITIVRTQAAEIAAGRRHRDVRPHRHLRARDRPDGGRLADRQSVLALHLLSQSRARARSRSRSS